MKRMPTNIQLPEFLEPLWFQSLFRLEAKADIWSKLQQDDETLSTHNEQQQLNSPTSDDALFNVKRSKTDNYSVHELRDKAHQSTIKVCITFG